jgi:D-alanyl-D-alanine carboxypeptidase (penicillin-binding protein 5/6)
MRRSGSLRQVSVTGPHVATVIFVVLMLSAAAIGTANWLAVSESASGNEPIGLTAENPVSDIEGPPQDPSGNGQAAPQSETESWEDAPDVSAASVFAIDLATGEVLYAKNEHEERDIASTVKIMTALVTIEHADLGDEVIIEEGDLVDTLVYSNMALIAGDTLTVEQLLTGLLVASGSDGALALARHVGAAIDPGADEPEAVFVDAMNEKAAELGMEDSHFTNPEGDDADGAHSSAYDMVLAGSELLNQPVLADIVSEANYSFTSVGPEVHEYTGVTTNQLLTEGYEGIRGIKTGSTEEAGGCIILAQADPETKSTVVIAVLGSDLTYENGWIAADSRWDDTRALLDWLGQRGA